MGFNFSDLVARILTGDEIALQNLVFASDTVIKTWARRERQELAWIAYEGKWINYKSLLASSIDTYIGAINIHDQDAISFGQFKEDLIRRFERLIKRCFAEFLNILKKNDEPSWKLVFNDLEKRTAAWFYRKSPSMKDDYHTIFCESFELIYVKFMDDELSFTDSSGFKSYFFKTVENKLFESLKESNKKRMLPFEELEHHALISHEFEKAIEDNELKMITENALHGLNEEERHILTQYFFGGKKLKEIAILTGKTEENVRIKKFRAMKKLYVHFKRIGYGS